MFRRSLNAHFLQGGVTVEHIHRLHLIAMFDVSAVSFMKSPFLFFTPNPRHLKLDLLVLRLRHGHPPFIGFLSSDDRNHRDLSLPLVNEDCTPYDDAA
jgi:hypothetical protein